MILKETIVDDNFTMMRGISRKILIAVVFLLASILNCLAIEKIGIISDTILFQPNYYNEYFKTPDFFMQDVRQALYKRGVNVVAVDVTQNALQKAGLTQKDLQALQNLSQGYRLEYPTLRKVAKSIGVKKLVVVSMGMEVQRDFLKNTAWNVLNVSGMDVVNPTHRVSVYTALVDTNRELVLWESIYAKNIRNNKMKNLDTTISGNYEGMLRLKEYSKYISPDIAYNVKMKLLNENNVEPPTAITRDNLRQYAKDRHNIGVKKELSEIERQKWDGEKLREDTKENIVNASIKTKDGVVKASRKTKQEIIKASKKTKKGIDNLNDRVKYKFKKRRSSFDWSPTEAPKYTIF